MGEDTNKDREKKWEEWEDPVFAKMKEDAYEYISSHFGKTMFINGGDWEEYDYDEYENLDPDLGPYHSLPSRLPVHGDYTAEEIEELKKVLGEDVNKLTANLDHEQ